MKTDFERKGKKLCGGVITFFRMPYMTRWIEAHSSKDAEQNSIECIRNDRELLERIQNNSDNPFCIHAQEIVEVESFEQVSPSGSGYSFYEEDDKNTYSHFLRRFWKCLRSKYTQQLIV